MLRPGQTRPRSVPVLVANLSISIPKTLQFADEQIWQRVVALSIERQMLTVPKTATGEQHRHVAVVMT